MAFIQSLIPLIKPVLVGAFVMYVFGYLWYGVVFRKTWMRLKGMPENFKPDMTKGGAIKSMVIKFLLDILTALAFCLIGLFPVSLKITCILAGIIWFGFMMPGILSPYLWDNKSLKLVGFDMLFSILAFALLAVTVFYVH